MIEIVQMSYYIYPGLIRSLIGNFSFYFESTNNPVPEFVLL